MQLPDAVREHRGVGGGKVELAVVGLGNVGKDLRSGGPFPGDGLGQMAHQDLVAQMTQRVALHGEPRRGRVSSDRGGNAPFVAWAYSGPGSARSGHDRRWRRFQLAPASFGPRTTVLRAL